MRWATLRYWKQPSWFFSPAWWETGSGFTLCPSGQVFLKAGVLPRLEKQREKLVSQSLVLLQAACRGFLSRQKFRKLKVALLCSGGGQPCWPLDPAGRLGCLLWGKDP